MLEKRGGGCGCPFFPCGGCRIKTDGAIDGKAGGRKQEMCGDSAALLHFHDDGPHEVVHFMQLQSESRDTKTNSRFVTMMWRAAYT